jgi:aprataxin
MASNTSSADQAGAGRSTKMSSSPTTEFSPPPKDTFPVSASFQTALAELVATFEAQETLKDHSIHQVVFYASSSSSSSLEEDEAAAVCFYDKFPKARIHVLLVPRSNSPLGQIESLADIVPSEHLQPLQQFHGLAHRLCNTLSSLCHGKHGMLCGYHAIPSLTTLHLHIISSDFDSVCVKTKKHINSFTSSQLFVSPSALEAHLQNASSSSSSSSFGDRIRVMVKTNEANAILNATPFVCFRCGEVSKNVPQWKKHNQSCQADIPELPSKNSLLDWEVNDCDDRTHRRKKSKKEDDREANKNGGNIRQFFGAKSAKQQPSIEGK